METLLENSEMGNYWWCRSFWWSYRRFKSRKTDYDHQLGRYIRESIVENTTSLVKFCSFWGWFQISNRARIDDFTLYHPRVSSLWWNHNTMERQPKQSWKIPTGCHSLDLEHGAVKTGFNQELGGFCLVWGPKIQFFSVCQLKTRNIWILKTPSWWAQKCASDSVKKHPIGPILNGFTYICNMIGLHVHAAYF